MPAMKRVGAPAPLQPFLPVEVVDNVKTGIVRVSNKFKDEINGLTILTISDYASSITKAVNDSYSDFLKKRSVADSGEIGAEMSKIFLITENINPSKLKGKVVTGFLGRAKSAFGSIFAQAEEEFKAQYTSAYDEVSKIVMNVEKGIADMKTQNNELEVQYKDNLFKYKELDQATKGLEEFLQERIVALEGVKARANSSQDMLALQEVLDFENFNVEIEKRLDNLRKIQKVALLSGPEIRRVQTGNVALMSKFKQIQELNVPLWMKLCTLKIEADKQKERANQAHLIDEQTNAMLISTAQAMGANAVDIARIGQRSVVDTETLETMTNILISSNQQVKAELENGSKNRQEGKAKMDEMDVALKAEFLQKPPVMKRITNN